jgi:hypothetical protein
VLTFLGAFSDSQIIHLTGIRLGLQSSFRNPLGSAA